MRLIAHISDLHFGRHDARIAKALLASLAEAAPDLVVVSGDLTQRARTREFMAARAFLDAIAAPALVVPGNHDVPLYHVARRFLRPLTRFRRYVTDARQPFFVDDEMAVLGISTARSLTFKNGRISFRQMSEIRAAFASVPGDLAKVLVTHHPLLSSSSEKRMTPLDLVGRAEHALDAVVESGVHLLLSGHYHRAFSGDVAALCRVAGRRSILVVQAGTAISTRTRDGEANTYNLVRIAPDRLSVELRAWTGTRFSTAKIERYRLEDRIRR